MSTARASTASSRQKVRQLMRFFDGTGWHVVEAKYGRRLQAAFSRQGGDALRAHIDEMLNEEYQSLFAIRGADLRDGFWPRPPDAVKQVLRGRPDDDVAPLVQNLGGHDIAALLEGLPGLRREADRPSVVFAYTVKGWGLPMAGDPLNHSALLSAAQIDELRAAMGLTPVDEWAGFDPTSSAGRLCAAMAVSSTTSRRRPDRSLPIPDETGGTVRRPVSTQETFGRVLTTLADVAGVGDRIVTASPDVSVSTSLGGWINKVVQIDAMEMRLRRCGSTWPGFGWIYHPASAGRRADSTITGCVAADRDPRPGDLGVEDTHYCTIASSSVMR